LKNDNKFKKVNFSKNKRNKRQKDKKDKMARTATSTTTSSQKTKVPKTTTSDTTTATTATNNGTNGSKSTRTRNRKRKPSYGSYIYKILQKIHKGTGVSGKAMNVLVSMTNDIFDRLVQESNTLVKANSKGTLSVREIQTAVKLLFPGQLAFHGVSEGNKAVTKYSDTYSQ